MAITVREASAVSQREEGRRGIDRMKLLAWVGAAVLPWLALLAAGDLLVMVLD